MRDVALARATEELLEELARTVATRPVDPPGVTDHAWLSGDATEVQARLRRSVRHSEARGGGGWIVLVDGRPAGLVTAKVVDGDGETFSVIAADLQDQGLATAARAAVVALLRDHFRVRRVVSTSRAGSASARVSQRLGYGLVGREVRPHPEDGSDVVLDRYELDTAGWAPPPDVEPARLQP